MTWPVAELVGAAVDAVVGFDVLPAAAETVVLKM